MSRTAKLSHQACKMCFLESTEPCDIWPPLVPQRYTQLCGEQVHQRRRTLSMTREYLDDKNTDQGIKLLLADLREFLVRLSLVGLVLEWIDLFKPRLLNLMQLRLE